MDLFCLIKSIGLVCFATLINLCSSSQVNALCIYEWETTSFSTDPEERNNYFPDIGASLAQVTAVVEFDLPSKFVGEYSFATDAEQQSFPIHYARFELTVLLTNGDIVSNRQGAYSYGIVRSNSDTFSFWLHDYYLNTMFQEYSIYQDYGLPSGVTLEVTGGWREVSPIPEPSSVLLLFSGLVTGLVLHCGKNAIILGGGK